MWIIVVGGFILITLHNFVSALMGFDELVFFIAVVFLLTLYFVICVVYSLIRKFYK